MNSGILFMVSDRATTVEVRQGPKGVLSELSVGAEPSWWQANSGNDGNQRSFTFAAGFYARNSAPPIPVYGDDDSYLREDWLRVRSNSG